jgi:hypothetical protein
VGFLDDNSTTLLRDGRGAHLRISSRDGAKVAGWGAAAGVVIVEESLEVVREGGAVRETG